MRNVDFSKSGLGLQGGLHSVCGCTGRLGWPARPFEPDHMSTRSILLMETSVESVTCIDLQVEKPARLPLSGPSSTCI